MIFLRIQMNYIFGDICTCKVLISKIMSVGISVIQDQKVNFKVEFIKILF